VAFVARLTPLTCVASLALACLPVTASHAAALELVDRATRPATTDGTRYVVYPVGTGQLRVRDTATGNAWMLSVPADCELDAASTGVALLNCGSPVYPVPHLLSLRTGALSVLKTLVPLERGFVRLQSMGRMWVSGTDCPHGCHPIYVNRRTGEVASTAPLDDHGVDYPEVDLDAPALLGRPGTALSLATDHRIVYRHGGPSRTVAVCRAVCVSSTFAGHWGAVMDTSSVTPWTPSSTLRIFGLDHGRKRATIRIGSLGTGSWAPAIKATKTRLVLSAPVDDPSASQPFSGQAFDIYWLAWPTTAT
jgi:hypothetical protein